MTTAPKPQTPAPVEPTPEAKTPRGKGLGIASLVLGIVAICFCWVPIVNILFIIVGVVGLILGFIGLFVSHRWLSAIGAVVSIVGIILAAVVNVSFAKAVSGPGPAANSGSAAGGGTGGKPTAGIGQAVTSGDLQFVVTGKDTAHTLGSDGLESHAKGKYVILDLKVKNVGKDSATFNAGPSQVAYDSSGNKYETSDDAMMSGNSADQNSFLQQLNPGQSETGRLVYDVPSSVNLVKVDLHGGMLSSPAHVSLSK
jgi:hypothetical protein